MIQLQQEGVGLIGNDAAIFDPAGSGMIPIQTRVEGTATFRLMGRVYPGAPWQEIREAATEGWLESFAWCQHFAIDVTSGDGTVKCWIGNAG